MSRKIGLGDTHFDPDIAGDIDFDFFGDIDGGNEVEDAALASAAASAASTSVETPPLSGKSSYVSDTDISRSERRQQQGVEIKGKYTQNELKSKSVWRENDKEEHHQRTASVNGDHHHLLNGNCSEGGVSARVQSAFTDSNSKRASITAREVLKNNSPSSTCDNTASISAIPSNSSNQKSNATLMAIRAENDQAASKELQRVAAGDYCGSPLSDSSSDSASDLYSVTDESLDDDYDDFDDSDSEITDVSPLSSANMSPLPESPKRTPEPRKGSSPQLGLRSQVQCRQYLEKLNSSAAGESGAGAKANTASSGRRAERDTVDLKLLAKAIVELEEERQRMSSSERSAGRRCPHSAGHHSSPHSSSASTCIRSRKNMTFTNAEVKRIEQENQRLLRRIIDSQKPRKVMTPPPTGKVSSSAVNRLRDLKKIETENLALLKRLQAAKPTKELSREYLLGSTSRNGTPVSGTPRTSSTVHSSPVARMGRCERSLSTGNLCSTASSSCASSSALANRSRSLKVSGGLVSLGRDGQRGGRL